MKLIPSKHWTPEAALVRKERDAAKNMPFTSSNGEHAFWLSLVAENRRMKLKNLAKTCLNYAKANRTKQP